MHYAYHHPVHGLSVKSMSDQTTAELFAEEIGPKWKLLPGIIEAITLRGEKPGYFARLSHAAGSPTAHCYDTPAEAAEDLLRWSQGLPGRMKEVFYSATPTI